MAKRRWAGDTAYQRRRRAANREKSRAYMRVYMRGWRAANLEISRANVRDSIRRAKERDSAKQTQ